MNDSSLPTVTIAEAKSIISAMAHRQSILLLSAPGVGKSDAVRQAAAAAGLDAVPNALLFSFGSDGTDGPTDAAGGIVDQDTCRRLTQRGVSIHDVLADNDSYHALAQVDGLIVTGPTGTNVNDVAVALIQT